MKQLFIFLVRGYRRFLSPLLGPHCRFRPTCSEYAIQAVTEWGFFRGFGLTMWRILRCNPFCRGGDDPVPKRRKKGRFAARKKNADESCRPENKEK